MDQWKYMTYLLIAIINIHQFFIFLLYINIMKQKLVDLLVSDLTEQQNTEENQNKNYGNLNTVTKRQKRMKSQSTSKTMLIYPKINPSNQYKDMLVSKKSWNKTQKIIQNSKQQLNQSRYDFNNNLSSKIQYTQKNQLSQNQETYSPTKPSDVKYITLKCLHNNDKFKQVVLCQSRYDNSKKIKKIYKGLSKEVLEIAQKTYEELRKINHPNIITYEEIYTEQNNLIVISRFIEGNTLKEYINSQKVKDNEYRIIEFVRQIQSALDILRSNNLKHGDIRPANILITKTNTPVLINFSTQEYLGLSQNSLIEKSYYQPPKEINISNKGYQLWELIFILLQLQLKLPIQLIKRTTSLLQLQKLIALIKNKDAAQLAQRLLIKMTGMKPFSQKLKQIQSKQIPSKNVVKVNEKIEIKQSFVKYEKKIKFIPKSVSVNNKKEVKIQQKIEDFTQNIVDLFKSQQKEIANHIIYDSYKRCAKIVDTVESIKVQQKLQQKSLKQPHPLIILGGILRQQNKKVHYSEKSDAFSMLSILLLSMQIGVNMQIIKTQIDYSITQQNFNLAYQNQNELIKLKQQIKEILMKFHNETQSDQLIIYELQWKNQKIIAAYYYPTDHNQNTQSLRGGTIAKQLSRQSLLSQIKLSEGDFDPRGDIDFINQHTANQQIRGGLPYFQPNGWKRFGINVKKFNDIDKNTNWLQMNGNHQEWAVMFHGLRHNVPEAIINIKQNGFKIGAGQSFKNSTLFIPKDLKNRLSKNPKALQQYKKQQFVGTGIYGSPLINAVCLSYTIGMQFGNQEYKVAFQCRIHPEKVYMPSGQQDYWVIRDPKYIRPYGLLVGKTADIQKQNDITKKFQEKFQEFRRTGVRL